MADGADVSNYEQVKAMVAKATEKWGSVDLLCANAGILRDKSFAKMEIADFAKVLDVHLTGTFYCCKAVWDGMRERNYGRIVVTTSSSGLYGNFGQANYGAAKTGMIGLMNVLAEEGRKTNIRVNMISPTAATRMTEELLPPQALALMKPESITPAVLFLLAEDAPTRTIMGAGAGSFAVIKILETEGINLAESDWTPDAIAAHFAEIGDMSTAKALEGAFQQTQKYVAQAAAQSGREAMTPSFRGASEASEPGIHNHDRASWISADSGLRQVAHPGMTTVAIIGAGPAGLMAAEVLAQGGAQRHHL